MLTIAIPTFNRNAILLRTLEQLLPQLNAQCRLLIIDNCSPVPIEETLRPLLARFPEVQVEIERNRVNIGANANILRCFEWCKTPWLWTLGDDDEIKPNAIEIILRHVTAHPQAIYFNFLAGYSDLKERAAPIWTRGVADFVEKVDSIANVLFISSGVYHAPSVIGNLNLGYAYIHTQPNFIPLLTSLRSDGVCCLADEQIVTYTPPDSEGQWSLIYYALGIMALLELSLQHDVRQKLARKIADSMPWHKMLVLQLLLLAIQENDSRGALYLYDQLCWRLYYFDKSPAQKFKIRLYRLMLRFPRASHAILVRWKRKKSTDYTLQDRFERV